MTKSGQKHVGSFWEDTFPREDVYPPLGQDLETDVCIVGGGITGVTAAYLLSRKGMRVVLVEADRLGSGTTGATTAHLDPLTDTYLHQLIKTFGTEETRYAVGSGKAAIELIENTILENQIDCGFARLSGYRFTERSEDLDILELELDAAREVGVPAELIERPSAPFGCLAALRFDVQAQFSPLPYLSALAEECCKEGCHIFEETRVTAVEAGTPCEVTTTGGTVRAKHVFLATHIPVGIMLSLQSRVFPYRSYAIGARIRGDVPAGVFWDTQDPYHYIRKVVYEGEEILLIGGEDHKVGHESNTPARVKALESYARARFDVRGITHFWSSQLYLSSDGLPFIGPSPLHDSIFVATGFAGNGITFGTAAAMIVTDQIIGRPNEWADVYTPRRITPISSAKRFIKENVDVAVHLIRDRLSRGETDDFQSIGRGEGAIVEIEGNKYAAYRERTGELHVMSAVCTHAGCIVGWNPMESSWDCPCHGGRYKATGDVQVGPPVFGLRKVLLNQEPGLKTASVRRRRARQKETGEDSKGAEPSPA